MPFSPPLPYVKHIYDSLHGYIGLTEQELNIVDSPIFQRLHNIRHLGTAYLVYPGATQTRFAHSLGTMYLMGQVAEKLLLLGILTEEEEVEKLRLAALLHDVGHFPYSHTLEAPIKRHSKGNIGDHERFTTHLIKNSSLRDAFSTYDADEIASIISKEYVGNDFYSLLISSDLDVDRMDYLLRDAHETGVTYGNFDVDRLIQTLRINVDEGFLAVEEKGRQALENFLLSRYHMYQTVYYHKTVVGFSLLLERIYEILIQTGKAYTFEKILSLSEEDVCNFNDAYIWNLLCNPENNVGVLGELIACFKKRKRLKMIKEIDSMSISGVKTEEHSKLELIDSPRHRQALIELANIPSEWLFNFNPKPLEIISGPEEERAIRILKNDGTFIPIAKEPKSVISLLFKTKNLSSRIYSKDEYEKQVLEALNEYLQIS